MVKALESADNLHIEESESNVSSDNPNMDGSDSEANVNEDQADSDEGSLSTRMQKKLEEKANQAFDKAADKVSKKVILTAYKTNLPISRRHTSGL